MPVIPMVQRPPPIINPQQPILLRLHKLLPFSSRTAAIPPVRNHIEPSGPLDVCPHFFLLLHLTGQSRCSSQLRRPYPTISQGPLQLRDVRISVSARILDHCLPPDCLQPHPLPSLPVYTIYQPGGLFVQVMHFRLLLMSLTHRVNCATLQQVLPALTMNISERKTMFPLHSILGRMEGTGIVFASSIVRWHPPRSVNYLSLLAFRVLCTSIHMSFVYPDFVSSLTLRFRNTGNERDRFSPFSISDGFLPCSKSLRTE
ncbi:hypothetical protein DEU56DRAFT_763806 [Suillus clintonianus]|uniref:uncharacterized protein n=1 Tax=Suillus clintonianus TaxID=1904413 RepID=UPI001B87FF39|nr:uncharacterized protein DEU56DRAFT_763806 [Suillus clintonianus]KAG2157274.1 hypothetical protein DEU56DRAFT_763806 [Suillus clintonianus]